MLTTLNQREVFHILFLRQLAPRLKPASYSVKGGVNLRFFFGSVRYSEDMDIDISAIEPFKLKELVMDILASKTLLTNLRSFQINKIVPPDIKAAKQTDTPQRFKVHLMTEAGEDLFTKVEFSRRRLDPMMVSESVSDAILRLYKISPFVVSHYRLESAVMQKIKALAERAETQARDIFDLYVLIPKLDDPVSLIRKVPATTRKKACENVFSIDHAMFRDTVIDYLGREDQKIYGDRTVWEEIQLKVGGALE